MMKRTIFFISLLFVVFIVAGLSQEKNPEIIAIKNAKIVPVVGQTLQSGILLIKNGLIEAVGKDVDIPSGAKVIDAEGLTAFPGMIDSACTLGLQEIGSVPATIDVSETGRINPQVFSIEAVRPDSVHIPISRSNGITTALVVPAGGLIAGKSSLIRLVGYTPDELLIKSPVALHIEFPSGRSSRRQSSTSTQDQASRQIVELKDLLKKARYYQKRNEAAKKNSQLALPEFDEVLENLLPVINGDL
ncbi:hypothetical protein ACFLRW_08070, partial [Acidobacteriota bacterium]